MRFDATRALIAYAGCITLALGWMLVRPMPGGFDTIDVQRINLREGDGRLRMVIANRDRFPGIVVRGREHPHPGRADAAGLLFFNDEATENGGLIFGGARKDGKVEGFGHLSFDQYEQDQVLSLDQTEADGKRTAGLTISDRPSAAIDLSLGERLRAMTPAARNAAIAQLRDSGAVGRTRGFFGKDAQRASVLDLLDAAGRARLRLRVSAEGTASIQILDEHGAVTRDLAS